MGDARRLDGPVALDEMGRQVAARLGSLPDAPAETPGVRVAVPARLPDGPPALAGPDAVLAAAEAAWADWRRRLGDWRGRAGRVMPPGP